MTCVELVLIHIQRTRFTECPDGTVLIIYVAEFAREEDMHRQVQSRTQFIAYDHPAAGGGTRRSGRATGGTNGSVPVNRCLSRSIAR